MQLSFSSLLPFTIAGVLSLHGLRKSSLSPSGALCAFVVGSCMFTSPLRAFGVTMIVFYLIGSRATKYGKQLKAKLEYGHHEAGYRTAWQVICNSLSAFIACVLWNAFFVPASIQARLISRITDFKTVSIYDGSWCPLSKEVPWSRGLIFTGLGHFACCMGDTLASELGILSEAPPMLITTWTIVPPGTNGAISNLGTFSSIGGGLLMGLTFATSLIAENSVCRAHWAEVMVTLVAYGCWAGFVGSLVDSLLGATLQRTRFSSTSKLVLGEDSQPAPSEDVKVISGLNVLSNNQVNLVSSALTATYLGFVGWAG